MFNGKRGFMMDDLGGDLFTKAAASTFLQKQLCYAVGRAVVYLHALENGSRFEVKIFVLCCAI